MAHIIRAEYIAMENGRHFCHAVFTSGMWWWRKEWEKTVSSGPAGISWREDVAGRCLTDVLGTGNGLHAWNYLEDLVIRHRIKEAWKS